eukprot:gnl/MRDRNA2_/MRDRNA2_230122_c0_seq1.p1 gnl/MRDRNA2_/MRDRNA2_230122_c0~~gnl/MRDRNA2_/MRDRNA2_230122_c0_seq1.p1  ORF type:complete len:463 (+),score=85.12 gnl/MRDRNA2_/MRDRNA2_230122_c0_seq1:87-1391(+)
MTPALSWMLALRAHMSSLLGAFELLPAPMRSQSLMDMGRVHGVAFVDDWFIDAGSTPQDVLTKCADHLRSMGYARNSTSWQPDARIVWHNSFGAASKLFVPLLAKFYLIIAVSSVCLAESASRSAFEEKCSQVQAGYALSVLKLQSQWMSVKHALAALHAEGHVAWLQPHQTPKTFVPGLTTKVLWDRNEDEQLKLISNTLEQNFGTINDNLDKVLAMPWSHDSEFAAYPWMVEKGTWYKWTFYKHRVWNATLCGVAKGICEILKPLLPSPPKRISVVPYVAVNDEEVIIFETGPGSQILMHNGPTNTRINIHMGVRDVEGSGIRIFGEDGSGSWTQGDLQGDASFSQRLEWSEGKVGPIFDDSFDHAVDTPASAKHSRFIIAVGVLHPDLRQNPGIYAGAFNRRTGAEMWTEEQHQIFEELAKEKQQGHEPEL